MTKRVPYKGRHVDEAMVPRGLRRRYIMVLTFIYEILHAHISRQVTKAIMGDPLSMFTGKSKLDGSNVASAAPLEGLKGKPITSTQMRDARGTRESEDSIRRRYEEGRANHNTAPQRAVLQEDNPEVTEMLARRLATERSSRYGHGRNRFVVLEDDVFSPTDDTEEAQNGRHDESGILRGSGEGQGAAEGRGEAPTGI